MSPVGHALRVIHARHGAASCAAPLSYEAVLATLAVFQTERELC